MSQENFIEIPENDIEISQRPSDAYTACGGCPKKKKLIKRKKNKEEKKIGLSKLLTGVLAPRQHGASG